MDRRHRNGGPTGVAAGPARGFGAARVPRPSGPRPLLQAHATSAKRRVLPVPGHGEPCTSRAFSSPNQLLRQISEAEQVADFERILATNAILRERVRPEAGAGAGEGPRPPSAYSLSAVTRLYHSLFAQHEHALRPLAERHRADSPAPAPAHRVPSILDTRWFHELTDLAQFYDEDEVLRDRLHALRVSAVPSCTYHDTSAASTFAACHEFANNITPATVEESRPINIEEEWPTMSACPGECFRDEAAHASDGSLERPAAPVPAAHHQRTPADIGRAPRDAGLVIHLAMPTAEESPSPVV